MGAPTLEVVDDFNRANGAFGSPWVNDPFNFGSPGAGFINGNQAQVQGGGFNDGLYTGFLQADVGAAMDVVAFPTGDLTKGVWLTTRCLDPGSGSNADGYQCDVFLSATSTPEWHIYEITNTVFTELGSTVAHALAEGDSWMFTSIGSTHTAWRYDASGAAWEQVSSRSSSTYNRAGYTGAGMSDDANGNGRWDNFRAGPALDPDAPYPMMVGAPGTLSQTSNSTSHSVPYPSGVFGGIQAGDLLLLVGAVDGSGNTLSYSGFTELKEGASSAAVAGAAYRWADGTETGSTTVTLGTSEHGSWQMFCVRYADPDTNPEVSTGASGSSTNPNPDSVTASWGSDFNLFFACNGNDSSVVPTAAPANYSRLITVANDSSGASTATAQRNLEAASDDPATFTMATEQWFAYTVVIRPLQADGPVVEDAVAGGADAGGVAPTAAVAGAVGGGDAGGGSPTVAVGIAAGGADAGGVAPQPVSVTTLEAGGAEAAGQAPTALAGATAGGAVAGGLSPADDSAVLDTPDAGGATGGGNPPSAAAAATAGGATGQGAAPVSIAAASAGGASADGNAPTVLVVVQAGGAVAAGNSPTEAGDAFAAVAVVAFASATADIQAHAMSRPAVIAATGHAAELSAVAAACAAVEGAGTDSPQVTVTATAA